MNSCSDKLSPYKKSEAMQKLSSIWNKIPNGRMPCQLPIKATLSDPATLKKMKNIMTCICTKYSEHVNNEHALALTVCRDIYNSIKAQDNKHDLNLINASSEVITPQTCSSDSNGQSKTKDEKIYRLSQDISFADITSQLNNFVKNPQGFQGCSNLQ